MKKSLIAAAGAVLLSPFLVLGTPTAHAYTPGECYGHSTDGSCAMSACWNEIHSGDGPAASKCVGAVDSKPQKIWDCSHWSSIPLVGDRDKLKDCEEMEACAETHSGISDCMGLPPIPEGTPKCGVDHPCN
jgi:hypothetical protein